jgi:hypothetical protein
MSQQINLYEARLRPRHELLTARNLMASLGVVLVLVAVSSWWVRVEADQASAELVKVQVEVKTAQETMVALTKSVNERKVSPLLQHELDAAKAMLEARREMVDYLSSGRLGSDAGFSGLMYGFARVAQSDLWLTGFSASRGGQEIEIRGSVLDSARLPGYVQRLSSEPVFQGRRFAALDMTRVDPAEKKGPAGSAQGRSSTEVPRIEFVLRSENVGESVASGATVGKAK